MRRHCSAVFVGALLVTALLPAHAVVLRFQPKVGDTHRHKLSMSGRMTMEMMGETMRGEVTAEMNYAEKALSREDDVTRQQTEILGGTVSVAMGPQSETVDLPTGRIVADIGSRGQLVELVEAEFEGEAPQPFMGSGPESMSTSFHYGAFPEGDVKEGDTWSDTISMPLSPEGPEVEMTFTSELLALTTFQSRKCAKIRTSFDAPLDIDMAELGIPSGEEESGTVQATLKGDMLMYYDYENSLYVYGEGTMGIDMSMAMPDMPGGDVTTKMIMNLKMAMVEP